MKTRAHRILEALEAAPEGKLRLADVTAKLGTEKNADGRNYNRLTTLRSRGAVQQEPGRAGFWSITSKGRKELQYLEDTPGAVRVPALRQRAGLGPELAEAPIVIRGPAVNGQAPRDVPSWVFALGRQHNQFEEGNLNGH